LKKKINITFCFLILFIIIVTLTVSIYVFNSIVQKYVYNDLKSYVSKITETDLLNNTGNLENEISFSHVRVTLIDSSGQVLYDSKSDSEKMENHSNREEFKEAVENGSGNALRNSKTIGKSTYYYAARLEDGNVLRISREAGNITPFLINALTILIPIVILIFIISLVIASRLTRGIIKPIEMMGENLENIEEAKLYDELVPFSRKIKDQQNDIRENQKKIESESKKIQLIAKNMSEGIIFLDKNYHIISLNDSAVKLLSLAHKEYEGKSILSILRNNDILNSIDKANKGEGNFVELLIGSRELQIFSNPVNSDDKDNIVGVICIILDITEKYNRDKMRREFTANVSHELKTPLTAISGYAELIEYNIAKKEDIVSFASKIHKESQRLLTLINDIIKLSQLDEGVATGYEFEEVSLLNIINQCINSLEDLAKRSEISINVQGEDLKINGNRGLLHELVYNLIDNALRYNKEKGSVDIELKKENDQVILSIKDTGIGIPDEYRDRVFERFFRVDASRSKATGGTGLGLSIVKHVASAHNARIECTSTESVGTQINIIFKSI
jgi:two-component system phosphate regulon sensor histidine kinase PhoR